MPIDASTRRIAVLGDPVGHSLSPLIHNTAFQHQQLNYCYLACPVRPDQLPQAVAGLKALQFAGANITIPHKQTIVPLLDHLSPEARAVGAVNTVIHRLEEGLLYGDNTDVAGFLRPLRSLDAVLRRSPMAVFGAGGAARAVLYALLTTFEPTTLSIVVRQPRKVEQLVEDLSRYDANEALRVVELGDARQTVRQSRLLVNATPLGMYPHIEETIWTASTDFNADQFVYDLVYNPIQTRLLQQAGARGATVIDGLEMFIGQAAEAYIQWTQEPMPIVPVRAALKTWMQTHTP